MQLIVNSHVAQQIKLVHGVVFVFSEPVQTVQVHAMKTDDATHNQYGVEAGLAGADGSVVREFELEDECSHTEKDPDGGKAAHDEVEIRRDNATTTNHLGFITRPATARPLRLRRHGEIVVDIMVISQNTVPIE